jgi:hypothetical protein
MAYKPRQVYNLSQGNSSLTLAYIGHLTKGFSVLEQPFSFALQENIRARSTDTVFGYLPSPSPSEQNPRVLRNIIGSNGYFLKLTTTLHGLDFIWHDSFNKVFLFWGPTKRAVSKAMNAIQYRINKITAQYEGLEEEDYSDVPELITSPWCPPVVNDNAPVNEDALVNVNSDAPVNPVNAIADETDYSDMPPLIPAYDE